MVINMRNTIIDTITHQAEFDEDIFLISGDAGFGVLDNFKDKFPDRFLNLGIAEQNTTGFAAGLSLAGFNVIIYNLIPFLLYRCYEQVRNDICYQNLPVTLVGIGSGVTYAPQGTTHYSLEDINIARSIPNLTILSPADPLEAKACIEYAIKSEGPVYIRAAKAGEPNIHTCHITDITKPILVKNGSDVAVLFHGSISSEVMNSLEQLEYNPIVISIPMLQPLNFDVLAKLLTNIHTVITVEEHYVNGGLGSIIADWILAEQKRLKLIKLGIRNEFIHDIQNTEGMRKLFGISSIDIKHTMEGTFNEK